MPLMHGKSKRAFGHNIRAELDAGKPQKQAVAIAYSEKRKAERAHKAAGGCIGDGCNHPSHFADKGIKEPGMEEEGMKMAEGGEVHEMDEYDHTDGHEDELLDAVCEELCEAIEKKDKKQIAAAIKALVLAAME